jgi:drug/metabolite transporter (DMT)-like permease
MALWIPITIAAAFMQNIRSAMQKSLSEAVGTGGATYARFLFALPFAPLYIYLLGPAQGVPLPTLTEAFFWYCLLGGIIQILATATLIHSFSYRNFAVGTTYSKTEAIQVILTSYLILGETVSLMGGVAIFISFIGVYVLSARGDKLDVVGTIRALGHPGAALGLASGGLFATSSVLYRGASHALEGEPSMFLAAAVTLGVVLVWQTAIMTGWFLFRDRAAITKTVKKWKLALPIGIAGVIASILWFTAVALYNTAYVRALGQVELLFVLFASVVIFKEKISRREYLGMALITGGIILMLMTR